MKARFEFIGASEENNRQTFLRLKLSKPNPTEWSIMELIKELKLKVDSVWWEEEELTITFDPNLTRSSDAKT